MKCFYVNIFILFAYLNESECSAPINSLMRSNTSVEQKVWNIKLDINFSKTLPPVIKKPLGSEVRLKCEAIMNFTKVEKYTKNKEGVETVLTEIPPDYIQQTVLKNVKVYWIKNNNVLFQTNKIKITTKVDNLNGTIGTNLEINNLDHNSEGNYTCVIKQNYEKKQSTKLVIDLNYRPTETYDTTTIDKAVTPELVPDDLKSLNDTMLLQNPKIEPICQLYVGKVCSHYLSGQFVYIPYNTTQAELEEKLSKAFQVTNYSNEISPQCQGYAVPSLCYSTFPICRDPLVSNENFLREANQIFISLLAAMNEQMSTNYSRKSEAYNVNVSQDMLSQYMKNIKTVKELLNYRYNSTVLRRVCKQDCEILENELCQTEYAIAKRHPHIGKQLNLEDCQDLPEEDPLCLKIGITLKISDDDCYWENGNSYHGKVNIANNNMPCIEWSKQTQVKVSDFPELAGLHSYCRNPGGIRSQPWCIVDKDGKTDQQICDIPKCVHKIWKHIIIVFLFLAVAVIVLVIYFYYRNKCKGNAAAIRDINLPNADKNIYGNSRLNSPIEMNELNTNQNTNQPHLARNTRGSGVLRVPQHSLSEIKFLEELGEGAFGKVYKGALKINGEVHYVAVKALKENASEKTKQDFRREIDLISELHHENIVCIVGVALKEEPLCMLFEFMARGDLHEFLMGRAPPSGKGLPSLRLLNIACNIAAGMRYLASHHYVHRDLAARNCLVSDDFVVKISDFGLSRDIYSSDYYRVQSKSLLPVRWMPPESILYGKFTTESDIWSYGVVLWEIYSYGLQPYYGYSNQEVISMVRGGELLASPAACPSPMYMMMQECWRHQPTRRPNFDEIVERLQGWIQMSRCPEIISSALSENNMHCGHRTIGSARDLQERIPLLPPHCSKSNGSLTSGSLKKFTPSSSKIDDNRSTCSEIPPLAPKTKKHSCGSLIDTDKVKETIIRIPNAHSGNDI